MHKCAFMLPIYHCLAHASQLDSYHFDHLHFRSRKRHRIKKRILNYIDSWEALNKEAYIERCRPNSDCL